MKENIFNNSNNLNKFEIEKLEKIYNDKFKYVYEWFCKTKKRHYTFIKFSNNQTIQRQTSSWRLEVKLGRKLNTSRVGGNETCDHIDNNKLNNIIDNLQLLTISENSKKNKIGKNNISAKLSEQDVLNILNLYYYNNKSIKEISLLYNNISYTNISNIINRNTWKHIPFKIPENFVSKRDNFILSEQDVLNILNLYYYNNKSIKEISLLYNNIAYHNIPSIINRNTWKHIPFKIPENFVSKRDNAKLSEQDVLNILNLYYYNNKSIKEISLLYNNINRYGITDIINRNTWKHIQFKIPENFIHKRKNSKLSEQDVLNILNLYYYNNKSIKEISLLYNNDYSMIFNVINRNTWKHIPFKIPENFIKINERGKYNFGENCGTSKLTEFEVNCIRLKRKLININTKELGKEYNISKSNINDIVKFKKWKHLSFPIIYEFIIDNKKIVTIPGKTIVIDDIKYIFIGKIINYIFPKYNCIYVDKANRIIKRKIIQ